MNTMQMTCGNCAGFGYTNESNTPTGDGLTVKVERDICSACNGKGYTEYAVFTVEEAKVILKHCGLSTESGGAEG